MTLARILARLRDSVGDGSIDDHHVRFFVGDVRAVVERLDACERVVEAARRLAAAVDACDREAERHPSSRSSAPVVRSINAMNDMRAALAALDGEDAGRG